MTGHIFAVFAKKLEMDQLIAPIATNKMEEKNHGSGKVTPTRSKKND